MRRAAMFNVLLAAVFAIGTIAVAASAASIPAADAQLERGGSAQVTSAHTHSYTGKLYYDAAHPHKEYKQCTICGQASYTGLTTTLPHGDGTSGTCKKCGTHTYSDTQQSQHPHELKRTCACGDTYSLHGLIPLCTICSANLKTATSTTPTTGRLRYLDGDQGASTVVLVPITLKVKYTNTYKYPNTEMTPAYSDYPVFASFSSIVEVSYTAHAGDPGITAVAVYQKIPYYDSNGNLIAQQDVSYGGDTSILVGTYGYVFQTGEQRPAYTIVSGVCSLSQGFGERIEGSTRTNFG